MLSLSGGEDLPVVYEENNPFVDYLDRPFAGLSLDYYFSSGFGLGFDYDLITNRAKNGYPTAGLTDVNGNAVNITTNKFTNIINRSVLGIGPNYAFRSKDDKWLTEINLRAGVYTMANGQVFSEGDNGTRVLTNYSGDFDNDFFDEGAFAFKGRLKVNYFFSDAIGLHLGVQNIWQLGVQQDEIGRLGANTTSPVWYRNVDNNTLSNAPTTVNQDEDGSTFSSVGIFAGLSFRLMGKSETPPPPPPAPEPEPVIENYSLVVVAKDKFTEESIPGVDVVIVNQEGTIIQTGKTNGLGIAEFTDMLPGDYTVQSKLYDVGLDDVDVKMDEFDLAEAVQKTITYEDPSFLVQGKVFYCNSPDPLSGVSLNLEKKDEAFKKTTTSDESGAFVFHLSDKAIYTLYAQQESFLSQVVEINSEDYNREQSLFVKLEVCAEKVECDKAIRLNNILYDLNSSTIREDAKPDLNRVVQFIKSNEDAKVELSSHTDSRGEAAYNLNLSQQRAMSAVNYIVSQGVSADRIIARGYGETKLMNECADGVQCTDAQHQRNRRTEFKVICPK